MKSIYKTPSFHRYHIDLHELIALSGGSEGEHIIIKDTKDSSDKDNRVKSGQYDVWGDDWNR